MRFLAFIAIASATICAATASVADTTKEQGYVQECMRKTGAQGAYQLPETEGIPQVTVAEGGSVTGAVLVNDCLLDIYQVQFARVTTISEGGTSIFVESDGTDGIYVVGKCGRGSNIFRGGSGYCID